MRQLKKQSAKRVQDALETYGYELRVIEFDESTRTSIDAANAIGCSLGQIAKSLIFRGKSSNEPILIIASGSNRVNEKSVKQAVGENLGKADADFVLLHTGYAIGGIPPIAHSKPVRTFMDEDLLQFDVIWAAAGTPHAVFQLTPQILLDMTKATVISVL